MNAKSEILKRKFFKRERSPQLLIAVLLNIRKLNDKCAKVWKLNDKYNTDKRLCT